MAPIKQEEQMKDKLERRTLQPSPKSWDTLANRLEAQENKKSTSLFWWFGVAASVVGIVFVTTLYFNTNSVDTNIPTTVDTQHSVNQKNNFKKLNAPIAIENVVLETQIESTENRKQQTENTNENHAIIDKNEMKNELSVDEVIAQTETNSSKKLEDQLSEVKNSELAFEDQKVQEVIAHINELKSNGNAVTDAEIDDLLKKAQKEIISHKIFNEQTRTVDAKALLQDVEDDLQQSFRSKVFEALQSGYESVKTAVAERNN